MKSSCQLDVRSILISLSSRTIELKTLIVVLAHDVLVSVREHGYISLRVISLTGRVGSLLLAHADLLSSRGARSADW